MFQRNSMPASAPTPCAIGLLRAQVALQEAESRRAPLELAGTRKLLPLCVPTVAGSANGHGDPDHLIAIGSG